MNDKMNVLVVVQGLAIYVEKGLTHAVMYFAEHGWEIEESISVLDQFDQGREAAKV